MEMTASFRHKVLLRSWLPRAQVLRDAKSPAQRASMLAEQPIGLVCLPLMALALWVLTHPYPGILGDASVYVGRALADLDPNGVGRDMVFVHDGQSRFSLFPLLLDHLVASFGTNATGILLAFLSIIGWVMALAAFAGRYVPKPFIAIVIIFVAVLPIAYGAPQRFSFSETIAVPRPFAEILVLLALSLLIGGRMRTGFASLIAATLIHPLMALAGWGVFAIVLSCEDRRWAMAFAGAAMLGIAGALAGLPLLHRLVTVMDPGLKAFAESRSPLLFPSAWPTSYIGLMAAQAASLFIAAHFVTGRARLVLIGALGVGILGIVAQILFGDDLSLLLVIQGQLWRMAWLTAALGSAAFAFCTLALLRQGARGQIVLALLVLAWLMHDTPECTVLLGLAAVAVHFTGDWLSLAFPRTVAIALWSVAVLLGIGLNAHYFWGYAQFIAEIPAQAPHGIGFLWLRRYVAFPILAAVLALASSRKAPRLMAGLLVLVTALLCVSALHFWDDRGSFQKLIDADRHPPELMQAIAGRPGEILWIDGLFEAWYLTGRPQWASKQQGVSTIFSRDLVTEWRNRMQFLIDQGLAPKEALATFHIPAKAELPRLTRQNVGRLCTRPDAPAWIVAPVYPGTIIPPGLATHEWRLAQPNFRMTEEPRFYAWQRIDAYAILPCATGAPKPR